MDTVGRCSVSDSLLHTSVWLVNLPGLDTDIEAHLTLSWILLILKGSFIFFTHVSCSLMARISKGILTALRIMGKLVSQVPVIISPALDGTGVGRFGSWYSASLCSACSAVSSPTVPSMWHLLWAPAICLNLPPISGSLPPSEPSPRL